MMYFPADDRLWPSGREIQVLRGSWEEVEVNDTPAVVVHGHCRFVGNPQSVQAYENLEMDWDDSINRLFWKQEGVYYDLFAGDDIGSEALVRMAESAR